MAEERTHGTAALEKPIVTLSITCRALHRHCCGRRCITWDWATVWVWKQGPIINQGAWGHPVMVLGERWLCKAVRDGEGEELNVDTLKKQYFSEQKTTKIKNENNILNENRHKNSQWDIRKPSSTLKFAHENIVYHELQKWVNICKSINIGSETTVMWFPLIDAEKAFNNFNMDELMTCSPWTGTVSDKNKFKR